MTTPPGREILGNIPPWLEIAMYAVTVGAAIAALTKLFAEAQRWTRGRREEKLLPLEQRIRSFARRAVAQRDIGRSDRLAGVMHLMIFWGFVAAFLATVLTGVEHQLGVSFLHGTFYLFFAFAVDLFGLLFVAGLLVAIYRRYVARPAKLGYGRPGDVVALGLLLLVGVTGFLVEGARIATEGWPAYERISFGGWLSGSLMAPFASAGSWPALHRFWWGVHAVAVAGFFVCLPFTRLLHMLAAPANILLQARPLGALKPVVGEQAPQAGLDSFTWKQLLELDACTSCGRCSQVCPARESGKPLSPMLIVQHLREFASGTRDATSIIGDVIDPEELWSCTTCGACEETCPVSINHIDRIVDLRRVMVDRGEVQPATARAMESMLCKGNPWNHDPGERAAWAERLGIRVLGDGEPCETIYWVGCAGAYDEQARPISEAVGALLKRAGVEFAILGPHEGCTGDLARRIGEEGLFGELAQRNRDALGSRGVRRIITHCPHCLNAFLNEYQLAGVEIVHHSVLLSQLIGDGRLRPTRDAKRQITFHDPCYLGRYHGIYDAPRAALAAIPEATFKEMPRNGLNSFCCGGGGGHMVIDVKIGERIPTLRFAEAEALGIDVIATACPLCKIMLAPVPAERNVEGKIVVKDVAELLAEACV